LLLWSLSHRASLIVWFSCPPHICPSWPGDKQYAEFLLFFATRSCLNITLTESCSFMCSVLRLYLCSFNKSTYFQLLLFPCPCVVFSWMTRRILIVNR
jgi:hypothetical protein